MNEPDNLALVPKKSVALEKAEPGTKRVLAGMVSDALALARVEDAEAVFSRGNDYYYGNGVPIDYTMAAKCYRAAAEKGYAPAQCRLGFCYEFGKGVPRNDGEAVRWYRMGTEQGHTQAEFYLGLCYSAGHGVAQDDVESVKWIRKAAEQGLAEAQQWMGMCHDNGTCGFPQNQGESVKWFRSAAEQGDAHSQYCLARCCLSGMGVVMDRVEALKWFRLAESSEEVTSTEALLSPEELQEAERRIRDFKAVHLAKQHRRSNRKIIVVNDEQWFLKMVEKAILQMFPEVEVSLFEDSKKAWQELSRAGPDLLITDDIMDPSGELNGEELVRRLVNKRVSYPIVVTSGWPPTIVWARQYLDKHSNVSFLPTPFTTDQLYAVLSKHLGVSILFSADHINPNLKAIERFAAIREMVAHLISIGRIKPRDEEVVVEAVTKREKSMSTGIGFGIASPRGRVNCVKDIIFGIGVSASGIEFDALDDQPVNVIAMFIAPANSQSHEVELQRFGAEISKALHKTAIRKQLLHSKSADEIFSILKPVYEAWAPLTES